jgi:hypothetical protein
VRTAETCRGCGSDRLSDILDLGDQHLSVFSADPDYRPPRFPLQLVYCHACTLGQLRHTTPAERMFHDSYSFKSGISDAIRADLRDVVHYALGHKRPVRTWLDIASNDGTLLANVPAGIYRAGIDPLAQFANEARRYADEIVVDFFRPERFPGILFDVVTSISCFYDLDDPDEFVAGVREVLDDDGVWTIQQNYSPAMIAAGSVDNVSHEHLAYWSLRSLEPLLERHGLEVNDVQLNPINGGCFRTLVSRRGSRPVQASVTAQRAKEGRSLYYAYRGFAARAREHLTALGELVRGLAGQGERVYVYGASTRGAVLWQAAGLDVRQLPAVVERNPDKVGRWMSAIGAPIISEAEMRADPPPYLAIGPWWLLQGFKEREADYLRNGGRFIVPLPKLEVVSG